MADDAPARRRVDVGFSGGQVLVLRMQEDAYRALLDALGKASEDARLHEVEAEDSRVTIDLRQVVYVRLDTEQHRVGF